MTPERWERLKRIFGEALAVAPDHLPAFLDETCGDDHVLRNEVEGMLANHRRAGRFLDGPPPLTGALEAVAGLERALTDSLADQPPSPIEGYRLLRRIGAGGMGVVYEAEQEHPRRLVALKVIRGGTLTDRHRQRLFQREVEALARLRHPGIAAIYQSGYTQGGEPFFAMELVHGTTLDEAVGGPGSADAPLRDPRLRLQLFVKICEAVNYAHQRGVVHRDLKPANILVAPAPDRAGVGALPEVKILDFGIAQIAEPEWGASMATQQGMIQGTPTYMSPEQAGGRSEEVDLRTDVYSLGVILYEILAGAPPYELAGRTPHEALRIVSEERPRSLRASVHLDKDLETVVFKALEKAPARRYQSALALAEDVERYLAHEPILARAPSGAYLLGRLVRRHRVLFGFLATVFVVATAAAVFMTVQRNRAAAAEAQARREAARATAIKDFLKGVLAAADPRRKGRDARIIDVLTEAARNLDAGLPDEPEVEAALRDTLSEAFFSLGEFEAARHQAESAVRINERLSRDHPATLKSLDNLATAITGQGKSKEAEPLVRAIIARKEGVFGPTHVETRRSKLLLSEILLGESRSAEAEAVCREITAGGVPGNPADDELTRVALSNLGVALRRQNKLDEAESVLRRLVDLATRAQSERNPDTLAFMTNLVGVLSVRGKFEEAETLARRTLDLKKQVLGPSHAETVISESSLGNVLCKEKKAEGLKLFRELVELTAAPGFESRNPSALYVGRLGECFRLLGQPIEAERFLLESYRGLTEKVGAQDARTRDIAASLEKLYESTGKPAAAAAWHNRK